MGWQILNWNKINYSMLIIHGDSIWFQNNWNESWWIIRWPIGIWLNFEIKWVTKRYTKKANVISAIKIANDLNLNNCLWLANAYRSYFKVKKINIRNLVSIGWFGDEILSHLVQLSTQASKYKVHASKSSISKARSK